MDDQEVDWNSLQCVIRDQLRPYGFTCPFVGTLFDQHKARLVEMVKRSSLMGESNSALIVGPRGSGKSALLEAVVKELYSIEDIKDNLLPVRLNGLMHTDDNVSLKDIVRQLGLDTVEKKAIGSFAEKLTFLLDTFKTGSKKSKSILFILEEFDLFCGHKDQTLLYNLFDVAQSQQSPICVIGLSCRPDILSKLENRVRSRFSHQLLYLFENLKFSEYLTIAKNALSLPDTFPDKELRIEWNESVETVLQSSSVRDILKKYFNSSCNIRDLKRFLLNLVVKVGPMHPKLESGDFIDAFSFDSKDSKALTLQGFSLLEISLVIAMMHLTELYDGDPFNFEMVYHEYKKFLQKKMSFQNLDKAVVMKTFEHLQAIEFVREVSDSKKVMKRYVPVRLLIDSCQIREALTRYPNLPYELQQWAASSIVE